MQKFPFFDENAIDTARFIFGNSAGKCEYAELQKIWQSTCRFAEKIQNQKGYVAPEIYNADFSPLDLNKENFLLNCPDEIYDLNFGMNGRREHRAEDFITKITLDI